MAFGMLGVVGMQATLRANADLSKQRTEAMRIAQERMEDLRNFSVLATTPGAKAFADKASFGATAVTGYTTNTTYTVSGSVTPTTASPDKTLTVSVAWTDRTGATQNVTLVSAMANVAPELAASLVVSAQGAGGTREPSGRRRGIPPQAKNFGDGTSGFVPPQATPTVAWVFDNATGLITSVCSTTVSDNSALLPTDLTACNSSQAFMLIWGFIRFDLSQPPTATSIRVPVSSVPNTVQAEVVQTVPTPLAGTVNCFHGYLSTLAGFFCPVPVYTTAQTPPQPLSTWSGTLRIRAASMPDPISATLADATNGNRKVCRIRAPATYANITEPLGNQNLIVIDAGTGTVAYQCPNPPTFAHQPDA